MQQILDDTSSRHPPCHTLPGHRTGEVAARGQGPNEIAHERGQHSGSLRRPCDDAGKPQRAAIYVTAPAVVRDQNLTDQLVSAITQGRRGNGVFIDDLGQRYAVNADGAGKHHLRRGQPGRCLSAQLLEDAQRYVEVHTQPELELRFRRAPGNTGEMKHTVDGIAERFTQHDRIGDIARHRTDPGIRGVYRKLSIEEDDLPAGITQTRQHSTGKQACDERAADKAIRAGNQDSHGSGACTMRWSMAPKRETPWASSISIRTVSPNFM